MKFIEKLQNKPRFIRVQILWISVILTMIVIVSIWLSLLKFSLGVIGIETEISQEKQSVPALFTTLKQDFSLLKKNLQAGVEEMVRKKEKEGNFEVEITKPSKLPEL